MLLLLQSIFQKLKMLNYSIISPFICFTFQNNSQFFFLEQKSQYFHLPVYIKNPPEQILNKTMGSLIFILPSKADEMVFFI